MAARSARGSRLLATYNEAHWVRRVFAAATARAHEPHRSWFSPDRMRGLLDASGFVVRSDHDGIERARRLGAELPRFTHGWIRFHHVVIADVRARGNA